MKDKSLLRLSRLDLYITVFVLDLTMIVLLTNVTGFVLTITETVLNMAKVSTIHHLCSKVELNLGINADILKVDFFARSKL